MAKEYSMFTLEIANKLDGIEEITWDKIQEEVDTDLVLIKLNEVYWTIMKFERTTTVDLAEDQVLNAASLWCLFKLFPQFYDMKSLLELQEGMDSAFKSAMKALKLNAAAA